MLGSGSIPACTIPCRCRRGREYTRIPNALLPFASDGAGMIMGPAGAISQALRVQPGGLINPRPFAVRLAADPHAPASRLDVARLAGLLKAVKYFDVSSVLTSNNNFKNNLDSNPLKFSVQDSLTKDKPFCASCRSKRAFSIQCNAALGCAAEDVCPETSDLPFKGPARDGTI